MKIVEVEWFRLRTLELITKFWAGSFPVSSSGAVSYRRSSKGFTFGTPITNAPEVNENLFQAFLSALILEAMRAYSSAVLRRSFF